MLFTSAKVGKITNLYDIYINIAILWSYEKLLDYGCNFFVDITHKVSYFYLFNGEGILYHTALIWKFLVSYFRLGEGVA